jgi:hypothetical protein
VHLYFKNKINNMKQPTLLILIVAMLSACKKNDVPTTPVVPPEVIYKVKTFAGINGSNAVTNTYNTEGRITKAQGTNFSYEYSYGINTVTGKLYDPNLSGTVVYDLNADGFVTKKTNFTNAVAVTEVIYSYNANKQILKTVETAIASGSSSTDNYYYTNKSLDSIKTTFSNNADVWNLAYEYYTDKKSNTGNKNFGFQFYPENSDKLVKKTTFTAYIAATNTNNLPQINNYTYSFDALGRETQRVINGLVNFSSNYTYY